jgi:hypothetical protein
MRNRERAGALVANGVLSFVMGLVIWLTRIKVAAKPTNFGDYAIRLQTLKVFGVGFMLLGILCFVAAFLVRSERPRSADPRSAAIQFSAHLHLNNTSTTGYGTVSRFPGFVSRFF